ncbi:unnamed protein product [Bursaphelenchus xylophilus]|uniref:(pine wood nematode) hypothetical protein n=1 Tax=Bursaphelenchus xylophilus TaxID=6326 RepID=A0A1I7SD79_BURXY|nr:unnamed protein product [Bursaphelenchus xylophilus]CAG9130531.1 unnamed protein product [Bursaphelenchus xylophilus]
MPFAEFILKRPSNKLIIVVASAAGGCALIAWLFRRNQSCSSRRESVASIIRSETLISSVSDALYRLEVLLKELEAHRFDGELGRDKYDFMASVVNRVRGVLTDLEKFERNEFILPATDEIARTIWNSTEPSAKPGTLSVLSDDSFLSAIDDFSPTARDNPSLSVDFENLEFYKEGLEAVERGEVVYRKSRAEVCGCESDVDFAAKLWCLRQAFDRIFEIQNTKLWLIKVGRALIADILRHFKKDPKEFYVAFDRMVEYLQDHENYEQVCFELKQRRVECLNIWDVLFDFILLDSFDDLKKPPSGTAALVKNSFLSQSMRESTLNNLIWSLIKMKRSRLQNQDGFVSRFYDISQIVSPPLIMGLLGGASKEFEDLCTDFKESIFMLLTDLFNPQQLRFNSLEELTEDVKKVMISRLETIQLRISNEPIPG